MAIVATVTSQQTIQFDVPAAGDAATSRRVFLTTGIAQFALAAYASSGGGTTSQAQSVKLLVDPVIEPGQFRKAVGIVGLANVTQASYPTVGQSNSAGWRIDDIATSLDDESGKVELRFEATATSSGLNANAFLNSVTFQVTTIAAI